MIPGVQYQLFLCCFHFGDMQDVIFLLGDVQCNFLLLSFSVWRCMCENAKKKKNVCTPRRHETVCPHAATTKPQKGGIIHITPSYRVRFTDTFSTVVARHCCGAFLARLQSPHQRRTPKLSPIVTALKWDPALKGTALTRDPD